MTRICIILAIVIGLIVGCSGKPTEAEVKDGPVSWSVYSQQDIEIEGMTYRLFWVRELSSQTGYAIHSINITLDKLKVAALRLELSKAKPEKE